MRETQFKKVLKKTSIELNLQKNCYLTMRSGKKHRKRTKVRRGFSFDEQQRQMQLSCKFKRKNGHNDNTHMQQYGQ